MTHRAAKPCKLRPAALADLEAIWVYSAQRWSVEQADAYLRQLADGLKLLESYPELARERQELTPPVRVYRLASHLIVYRIEAGYLDVIRIRHAREDWVGDPGGE